MDFHIYTKNNHFEINILHDFSTINDVYANWNPGDLLNKRIKFTFALFSKKKIKVFI